MRIDLACANCGSNSFNLGHETDDDSLICCDLCRHQIGTMAELKERVAAEVLKRVGERNTEEER